MTFRTQDGQGAQALDINQLIDQLRGRGVISGGSVSVGTGQRVIDIESTVVYINETRRYVSSTSIDLTTHVEEEPRKGIVYVNTDGEIAFLGGEPEDPQPPDQYRFDTYRPAPPDITQMDCVVLAEVWLSPYDERLTNADIRDRTVEADLDVHSITAEEITFDTLIDGAGVEHNGELADIEDVPTDINIRETINNDPDHGINASHDYFSGSHSDLTDVEPDQHHPPRTDEETQDAIRGVIDASDLDGAAGAAGDHLESTGDGTAWSPAPSQNAEPIHTETITHSGGSSSTVTLTGVATDQTAEFFVAMGVSEPPAWSADYGFSSTVTRQWDSANSRLDVVIDLAWDTDGDPGTGNDLAIDVVLWDSAPQVVDGKFTDAQAAEAMTGATITPANALVSRRLKHPVYDNLADVPEPEIGDVVIASGNGADTFGQWLHDGVEWIGPLGTSVSQLSDIVIDGPRSWNGYQIRDVGGPTVGTDAARLQELEEHEGDGAAHHSPTTSNDIDHAQVQNVQPDQHHSPPTDDDIVEAAAGNVFSVSITGAAIPNGAFVRDYGVIGPNETASIVRGEFFARDGTVPSGLTLEVYDKGRSNLIYEQTSALSRSDPSDSLATVSGETTIEARIHNTTGSEVAASGIISYRL